MTNSSNIEVPSDFPDNLIDQYAQVLTYDRRTGSLICSFTLEDEEVEYGLVFKGCTSVQFTTGFYLTSPSIKREEQIHFGVEKDGFLIQCQNIELWDEETLDRYTEDPWLNEEKRRRAITSL